VNAVGTPFHADDMAALSGIAPDAIVLPKATPDAVDALGWMSLAGSRRACQQHSSSSAAPASMS